MTRRMAKASEKTNAPELPELTALELNRIVRLSEAGRLCGLSEDSLRRNHSDKIVRLGPRAIGMRVGHALHLMRKGTSA
jgi:hypothetical protein